MRYKRTSLIAGIALATLIASGCREAKRIATSVDEAVRLIDVDIAQLEKHSSSWQSIVGDLARKLPTDLQDTIRVEMSQVAERTVAKAGVEFRADVDFLAERATHHLRRIKAMLLNEPPLPIEPTFCEASPPDLNLNIRDAGRMPTIEVYGYDLDSRDANGELLRFVLVSADGTYQQPLDESRIGRTTHLRSAPANFKSTSSSGANRDIFSPMARSSQSSYCGLTGTVWRQGHGRKPMFISTTCPWS